MRQLDLFRKPRAPARHRPRTMHVFDAGNPSHDGRAYIRLWCKICHHTTGWVPERSVTAERKGRVCPICKGDPAKAKKGVPS
ncbi:hypothetical protein [Azospirillum agricola]|uniref:hypothetical protein n=1 Tax=Azospirillum agricola TaxID=1720247 RepID=UPI000A0F294F|nr:hypothetical protein [Azospirillum agricola]SMH62860.1 hypothetical protein SAMN02982994_6683 [Azospirillum lipoferum]